MGEGARPGRGGNNKIEGGEGVECCVFLSLKKHVNFVGDAPSPSHSHEPRPRDTGVTSDEHWEKGRVRGGGVLTRLKGEKGLSVVSFCH